MSSSAPNAPTASDRDQEADPVVEAPPDHRHIGDECAEHQQVALGEIDELGRLVDQHEAERDQAVDAADRKPIQGELQKRGQFRTPRAGGLMPPRPAQT